MRRIADKIEWLTKVAADTKVIPSGLRVAIVLANRYNLKTGQCNPGKASLMRDTGLSEEGVRKGIKSLENESWITVRRSTGGAGSNTNSFDLISNRVLKRSPTQQKDTPQRTDTPQQAGQLPPNVRTPRNDKEKRKEINKEKTPGAKTEYPPEFETLWKSYPKRSGNNPKPAGFKAWAKRIKEGRTPEELLSLVRSYANWCKATGKDGTEIVMYVSSFFGQKFDPDARYELPKQSSGQSSRPHVNGELEYLN